MTTPSTPGCAWHRTIARLCDLCVCINIHIYICIHMYNPLGILSCGQNHLFAPGTKTEIFFFFFAGGVSLYTVLFKPRLNNAKMQGTWFHRFRSLNYRGWIRGRSLSLRLQPGWEAIWNYLRFWLSKEICYKAISELKQLCGLKSMAPNGYKITISMKTTY